MRTISSSMVKILVNDLAAYCKKNGVKKNPRKMPTRLDSALFCNISYYLPVNGPEDIQIIERNGRPQLCFYDYEDIWNSDYTLAIGGVERIRNNAVRNAARVFLGCFLRNNPFTSFKNTVWEPLFDDGASYIESREYLGTEYEDFFEEQGSRITDITAESEAADALMTLCMHEPDMDRKELLSLLSSVKTDDTQEQALLFLLRENICYIYEKRWDDDSFDSDGYIRSSVSVNEYDYFPVVLKDTDVIWLGNDLINAQWDGDCDMQFPQIPYLLEPDGSTSDTYDRHGFGRFCNDLSEQLNAF